MDNRLFVISVIVGLLVVFVTPAAAEMSSTNYRITTTVMSGGGGPMESASYQTNSTVGQSTPIMEQGMDPYSDNYDLLPGFWYTIGAVSGCIYDYLGDGDVDGADLEEFTNVYSDSELGAFALEFGRVDCLP